MTLKLNIFKQVGQFIALVVLYFFLIITIWNKIILKKFPDSKIEPLTYWDSLLVSVFISLMSTGVFSSFYKNKMCCCCTTSYSETNN